MTPEFRRLTECVPGYFHSHIIQDHARGSRYAVCQRCHQTLSFESNHDQGNFGWKTSEFTIGEWP